VRIGNSSGSATWDSRPQLRRRRARQKPVGRVWVLTSLVLSLAVPTGSGQPATAAPPIFRFHADEFWLNLHHFLYVLGRSEAKMPDASRDAVVGAPEESTRGLATLSEAEQREWLRAVAFYAAGPSRKDAVFDEPLPAVTHALADAGDRAQLPEAPPAIDAPWRATLERVAAIYRKTWWPAHRAANAARQEEVQRLVDRHGAAVLAFITRAYCERTPSCSPGPLGPPWWTGLNLDRLNLDRLNP
jgi:hypothetical protein